MEWTKHVVSLRWSFSDAGSTPAASTILTAFFKGVAYTVGDRLVWLTHVLHFATDLGLLVKARKRPLQWGGVAGVWDEECNGMVSPRSRSPSALRVWGWPISFATATVYGLLAALWGRGYGWEASAWLTLASPARGYRLVLLSTELAISSPA